MNREQLQSRFWELTRQAEAIRADSRPLRAARDDLVAQRQAIEEAEKSLIEKYKVIEQPLFDIEQERAALVRALKGKVGQPR